MLRARVSRGAFALALAASSGYGPGLLRKPGEYDRFRQRYRRKKERRVLAAGASVRCAERRGGKPARTYASLSTPFPQSGRRAGRGRERRESAGQSTDIDRRRHRQNGRASRLAIEERRRRAPPNDVEQLTSARENASWTVEGGGAEQEPCAAREREGWQTRMTSRWDSGAGAPFRPADSPLVWVGPSIEVAHAKQMKLLIWSTTLSNDPIISAIRVCDEFRAGLLEML